MTNTDTVKKLWHLCDVLRDDGINDSNYVTNLVLLPFIKVELEEHRNGHSAKAQTAFADLIERRVKVALINDHNSAATLLAHIKTERGGGHAGQEGAGGSAALEKKPSSRGVLS